MQTCEYEHIAILNDLNDSSCGSSCFYYSASICVHLRPSADYLVSDVGLLYQCKTSGTFNDAERAEYVTLVNNFRYGLVQYTEEPIHACYSISGIESYDVTSF